MELLRFSTAGSVDDGKSTLIGRLLYDSRGAYDDQIAAVRQASRNGHPLDLSLLTDGLRAEREQGITIDVAYRYFSTPRRKFIIADTPGHEQYTRNMATGASTAALAVILVDARRGVLQQSRRHAHIAHLLGIPEFVVAVNKMDLVDYRREIFDAIRAEFTDFTSRLGTPAPHFIPLSALCGDNVVARSSRMPWYDGPPLLQYLEEVPAADGTAARPLRFPVQYAIRSGQDFRGYAGQLASGIIRPGDEVVVLPSGRRTRISSIVSPEGELEAAVAPMSITVTLAEHLDVSRGDMLAAPASPPALARRFHATVVWMSEKPLAPGRPYLLKHTTRQVRATVRAVRHRVDVDTLHHHPTASLALNEIGAVALETVQPLVFDPYRVNRATGSFILIDPVTNATAAAGMLDAPAPADSHEAEVTPAERAARYGHPGTIVWLDGTLEAARRVERRLFDEGCAVCVLDPGPAAAAACDAGFIVLCPAAGLTPPPGLAALNLVAAGEEQARTLHHPPALSGGDGI